MLIEDECKHRSLGSSCANCTWFVVRAVSEKASHTEAGEMGRCRKHAPYPAEGWPNVRFDDWCGDHNWN